ncbi:deoxyribonuclease [Pasteurellaceae bacterium 15-036681]|nr:deoxyribonuclease [Pasteurellaceae bacterium 15-036681]
MFDTHIHLEQYSDQEIAQIISNPNIVGVVAVSTNFQSLLRLEQLQQQFPKIHICAGFHPEQPLPSQAEKAQLFDWIAKNHTKLTAIGEVGLPHYLKRETPNLDYQPYIDLLEEFMFISKRFDLPLNLHIVYDDTQIALDLLTKHQIKKAHFHWFKASDEMLQKVLATNYLVSITPDILVNFKTQRVAELFPLERIMIETDGPWQHEGFDICDIEGQLNAVINKIAEIKQLSAEKVSSQIKQNTQKFYVGYVGCA